MTSVERALDRLRESGYKITNARQTVISVLCESPGHLTSAEVLEHVEARDPAIGRASVFRTLDLLTDLAIIRPTYLEPRTPNYVVMPTDGHHAHLVCTYCNQVFELDECHISEMLDDVAANYNFQLTGHLLELYGCCSDCAAADI